MEMMYADVNRPSDDELKEMKSKLSAEIEILYKCKTN